MIGHLRQTGDHVVDGTRDAPILMLCLARPELLDDRPTYQITRPIRITNTMPPRAGGITWPAWP